jgi:RNA polymerase sigma-54 factor
VAQAPKLQMKQSLGLTMTPEMKLSLEILQFDSLELADFIHTEIESNPVLEFDPEFDAPKKPSGDDMPKKAGPDISEIEGSIRREKTLQDHIQDQLSFLTMAPDARLISHHLAGGLNKAGYLTTTLDEIAAHLGCQENEVEKVLFTLQGFEPAGVFARDLKECLALQLQEKGASGKVALKLLGHLELVARRDLPGLEKETGLKGAALEKALKLLRELDPKPGERFGSGDPLQTRIPDVFVRPRKGGGFNIELNPETLPRLLINETYSTSFKEKTLKSEGKDFLQNCQRRAGWLKRALDQRAKTVLKVSESLVKNQAGFFEKGIRHLKPLTFREIALEIKMHESTISRVVANKYLAFPGGVYPLKYFFSSGVSSSDGEAGTSAHAIKDRVKTLIEAEPPGKPLSDDKLAGILKNEGVIISRRTVMKYREALGIPSSFERRKLKK